MKETLRTLREENGYSQAAVANFLGISRQMYIKYESGGVEPPVRVVVDLSAFYRVPCDVIIENKLNASNENLHRDVTYKTNESDGLLEVASPSAAAYTGPAHHSSYYLNAVLDMLPKLIYAEQLKVLSKLSEMVHKETEEKLEPSSKMKAYQKLLALNEELHLKSGGRNWTREELYER